MISHFFLFIIAVQLCVLTKIIHDAREERKKLQRRIVRIEGIIPEIKKHPNPKLADFFWNLGNEMNRDDDPLCRLLGASLSNYYTLLNQEIDRKYLYEEKFIKLLQSAMVELKEAFAQDNKRKLAEFAFALCSILFGYPSVEEDQEISQKLEKALLTYSECLKNKKRVIRFSSELDLLAEWNFRKMQRADSYTRFIFINVVRWFFQLPFEHPMGKERYFKKAEEIATAIQKSLFLAKKRDQFGVYLVLSNAYASLFPAKSSRISSSKQTFFKQRSVREIAHLYANRKIAFFTHEMRRRIP